MSFQSIYPTSSQQQLHHHQQQQPPDTSRRTSYNNQRQHQQQQLQQRDLSLDIGNLTNSSRRMSFDSQPLIVTPTTTDLSVMGNAIAPEHKPKVPTMSERDLTRRHSSCFTRNHAFLT